MSDRKDHRPFLGLRKELRYGRTPSGDLAAIEDVRRGAACDCVCPACGTDLVARKGEILIAHFAHAGGGREGCGLGQETNAHIWAKRTLESELRIRLPDVKAAIGDRSKLVKRGRDFAFAKATLEKRLETMTPDVVLTAPDGRTLIVEVRVTHASDADKVAKIREHGVSAIEVDLYPWRHCEDEQVVREALLSGADRHWLFNPAVDQARDDLRTEIEAEATRKAATAKRRAEQTVRSLRSRPIQRPDALKVMRESVVTLGLGRLAVGVKADDGFVTPGSLWKAAALIRLFRAAPVFGPLGQVTVDSLESHLQDCLAPEFRQGAKWDLKPSILAKAVPDFQSPRVAIEMFLDQLIAADVLYYRKGDHWLDPKWPARLADEETARRGAVELERRRTARLDELERLLAAIESLVPDEHRSALKVWRQTPLPGLTRTPAEIASEETEEWPDVREALATALAMLKGGPPAKSLVGLPLEAELAAAIRESEMIAAQEAQAHADAARRGGDNRVLRLRAAADQELGEASEAWRTNVHEGLDWESRARIDEDGLASALRALDRSARILEEQRSAQAALDVLHQKLRVAASQTYDPQRADLFVRTARPDLGRMSPLAYCVDEHTLGVCLKLLPSGGGGARRNRHHC